MIDPLSPVPTAAPPANSQPLLELRLTDAVAATVAVDSVVQTLRALGLAVAALDTLAAVLLQLLREAREREVFADDPPVVQVSLRVAGEQAVVRVSDQRMPQWGVGGTLCQSDQLVRGSRLDGFRRGEQGTKGNWAECVLNLPARALDGMPDLEPAAQTPGQAPLETETLQLRALRAQDAEGLVRLIYRVYGYSYVIPTFYSPKAVREALQAGGLSGIVAINDAGEVVGHVAVVPDAPYLTAEVGRLAVDPRHRGQKLASRLVDEALAQGRRVGTPVLWAECVANHPASQRIFLAAGGVEVGLLLDAFPTMRMSNFAKLQEQRQGLMMIAKPLAPSPRFSAHLPARLEPMYRQLIGALGLSRDIDTTDRAGTGTGTLALRVSLIPQVAAGFIAMDVLGRGGLERVRAELAAMIQARMAIVFLDIPLADPAAGHAIALAYQHGFIWGALFPCARADGDVLRLQWLDHRVVDAGDIQCASDHGQAMKEWVLGEQERWFTGS